MANEENLTPFTELSTEQHKELSRRGGIASGKARRKKANLKRSLEEILKLDVPDNNMAALLKEQGIDPSMERGLAYSLIIKAIAKGDHKAFETIRDTLHQSSTPADKREQKARTERMKAETERMKVEVAKTDGTSGAEHAQAQSTAIADMIRTPEAERILEEFMSPQQEEPAEQEEGESDDADTD